MTKIHLVMPMAGRGSRFSAKGYKEPKPLLQIYGKPFFYWSTQSVRKFVELSSLDFVVLEEHVSGFHIDAEIRKYFPEARIHVLPEVTEGAVITALRGCEDIDDQFPVVFNDCDHLFKSSEFNSFCRSGCGSDIHGILLTFSSNEPRYSFVGKDDKGNVVRTVEKEAISSEAICGCYYFSSRDVFERESQKYIKHCEYKEYFMSGVYNSMISDGMIVRSIPTDFHVSFGTPDEFSQAAESGCYKELL